MFIDGFRECNREDNFSYEGRKALYEHFIEMEYDEFEFEYDPIAVCCEYTEYDDLSEFHQNYDKETYSDIDSIMDYTQVIEVGICSFIIQNF